jgi:hypothetical protein
MKAKLVALERKIIVGGENLLEKAEEQVLSTGGGFEPTISCSIQSFTPAANTIPGNETTYLPRESRRAVTKHQPGAYPTKGYRYSFTTICNYNYL